MTRCCFVSVLGFEVQGNKFDGFVELCVTNNLTNKTIYRRSSPLNKHYPPLLRSTLDPSSHQLNALTNSLGYTCPALPPTAPAPAPAPAL